MFTYAAINSRLDKIFAEINDNNLLSIKVIATTDDLEPNGLQAIRNTMNQCSRLAGELDRCIGQMNILTLPSGELVKKRENWINKKEMAENMASQLKKVASNYADWLQYQKQYTRGNSSQ